MKDCDLYGSEDTLAKDGVAAVYGIGMLSPTEVCESMLLVKQ